MGSFLRLTPAMQCGIDSLPDTADTLLNYEEKNNDNDLEFAYSRIIFTRNLGRSITTAVDAFNLGIHIQIPVG